MFQATALQIIKQTQAELGLPVSNSVVASRETSAIQLLALLNAAGYELAHAFEWQTLVRKHTITAVSGQVSYALPPDFGKMINQTIWSSGSVNPVNGPSSSQEWQMRIEGGLSARVFTEFRIIAGQLVFDPAPTAGTQITFEYISNGWVLSYLDPSVYTPYVLHDLDTPLFDFMLMVKFLKLKMWSAKGLDTTVLESDFRVVLAMMTSGDKPAPKLSIARRGGQYYTNVPETGYGQ